MDKTTENEENINQRTSDDQNEENNDIIEYRELDDLLVTLRKNIFNQQQAAQTKTLLNDLISLISACLKLTTDLSHKLQIRSDSEYNAEELILALDSLYFEAEKTAFGTKAINIRGVHNRFCSYVKELEVALATEAEKKKYLSELTQSNGDLNDLISSVTNLSKTMCYQIDQEFNSCKNELDTWVARQDWIIVDEQNRPLIEARFDGNAELSQWYSCYADKEFKPRVTKQYHAIIDNLVKNVNTLITTEWTKILQLEGKVKGQFSKESNELVIMFNQKPTLELEKPDFVFEARNMGIPINTDPCGRITMVLADFTNTTLKYFIGQATAYTIAAKAQFMDPIDMILKMFAQQGATLQRSLHNALQYQRELQDKTNNNNNAQEIELFRNNLKQPFMELSDKIAQLEGRSKLIVSAETF